MRRSDKEITDRQHIEAIIQKAMVCRLAMTDGETPYVVPLCFGFNGNTLFFHSAQKGRKIELIRRNPQVCFEFDAINETVTAEAACDWTMRYQSVIGFGRAVFITSLEEKRDALDCIMAQYSSSKGRFSYPDAALKVTAVFKVEIEQLSGKTSLL